MTGQRWRPQIVKPDPNQTWIEHLRYSIDMYDERENLIEVLARISDLDMALAAFTQARAKFPGKRIFIRDRGRVVRKP